MEEVVIGGVEVTVPEVRLQEVAALAAVSHLDPPIDPLILVFIPRGVRLRHRI